MGMKSILDAVSSGLIIEKKELVVLKDKTRKIVNLLQEEIKKSKIGAEVFVGGSFAKGTLVNGEFYDVDIFIRFDWDYEDLSKILKEILDKIAKKNKLNLEKMHGSRDYFRIISENTIFEIVPVTKIKKPKEARNVTDLSYFHVNYVKNGLKKNLGKEVVLAKQFCKAQKVYGAESYVNGFSGYALECLIIHYKSFEKMLRELAKAKDRIIIDSKGLYKKKSDILFEMNESKLSSPIILVDPTWKERNALAALSRETFAKFQAAASAFLKKPSLGSFEIKKFDITHFKKEAKKGQEFVFVQLGTEKQPGDIAGTKMRKFSNYLTRELSRYFEIMKTEFEYSGESNANLYLIVSPKKEVIKIGPPSNFEKHAKAFKKQHKKVYEKNGVLYAKITINFSAKDFLKKLAKDYHRMIEGMGISDIKIN